MKIAIDAIKEKVYRNIIQKSTKENMQVIAETPLLSVNCVNTVLSFSTDGGVNAPLCFLL